MKNLFTNIAGDVGVIVVLIAYALISFNVVNSSNLLYQSLNLLGAIGIFYVSFKKRAYQPAALNVVWAIIAIVAIVGILI